MSDHSSPARVSVVIPCHDARPWLREAVESALDQRGVDVEVIVIDDGSTDDGTATIGDLDGRVSIHRQANMGGNHARNRGVERATGDYIQYLDADDYLLPGKFRSQVAALEQTGADIVYGDWRYQVHDEAGVRLMPVLRSGAPLDVLLAIVSGWILQLGPALLTREAVDRVGPWDESLRCAQDIAYWAAAARAGCRFTYVPGCVSVYRRYADTTVSRSHPIEMREHVLALLRRIESDLDHDGLLDDRYRCALSQRYLSLGRRRFAEDRREWRDLLDRAAQLHPDHLARQSRQYRTVRRLLGRHAAEGTATAKRTARTWLSSRSGILGRRVGRVAARLLRPAPDGLRSSGFFEWQR